jgi:hypothetical protein
VHGCTLLRGRVVVRDGGAMAVARSCWLRGGCGGCTGAGESLAAPLLLLPGKTCITCIVRIRRHTRYG